MEGGLITPPALIGTGPLMGVTSSSLSDKAQRHALFLDTKKLVLHVKLFFTREAYQADQRYLEDGRFRCYYPLKLSVELFQEYAGRLNIVCQWFIFQQIQQLLQFSRLL